MDSPASAARRPCFAVEDDGLASIAGVHHRRSPFSSRTGLYCSSPRFGRIFDARFEEANHLPHFLESCSLCKKPLGGNRDIFMYRGDMPFCSVDCRQEQIDMDEAREKSLSLSASMKAMRRKQKDSKESSPEKSQKYPFRAGAVAAG